MRTALPAPAAPQGAGLAPPVVHDVLRGRGRPLDAGTRAFMEPRFGHSFADVRVHDDARAAESARAVGAHAYTVGRDVVFGAGCFAPATADGRRLIAHELTHVVQQAGAGHAAGLQPRLEVGPTDAPEEREADLAANRVISGGTTRPAVAVPPRLLRDVDTPVYPTVPQQQAVQEIVNPQAQAAAAVGGEVPPVTDAPGFRSRMRDRMGAIIDQSLPRAQAREQSGVTLSFPALAPLADVIEREVRGRYAGTLPATTGPGATTPPRLRDTLHQVADIAPEVDQVACQWISDRMEYYGRPLMVQHNVLASSSVAKRSCSGTTCPAGAPTPEAGGGRDQDLFEGVRNDIYCDRMADVRTIILYQSSFERPGEVYIQTHLAPEPGEAPRETQRRGRWEAAGTLIHEMLHELAHDDFRAGVRGLENAGLAIEGFAEYFTRPVYDDLRDRAVDDDALRSAIEGVAAPWSGAMAPPRRGYQDRFEAVEAIRDALGSNEANLRAAYFLGQIHYLGLGGWTESEARRRHALRQPWTLGAMALVFPDFGAFPTGPSPTGGPASPGTAGGFRIQFGNAVLGREGDYQLMVGGSLQVLGSDSSVTLGPSLAFRYSWPWMYVQTGAALGLGGSLDQPLERGFRVDLIPDVEVGVQLGIVRIGGGPIAVIPLAGGEMSDRTIRLGGQVGISVSLGGN